VTTAAASRASKGEGRGKVAGCHQSRRLHGRCSSVGGRLAAARVCRCCSRRPMMSKWGPIGGNSSGTGTIPHRFVPGCRYRPHCRRRGRFHARARCVPLRAAPHARRCRASAAPHTLQPRSGHRDWYLPTSHSLVAMTVGLRRYAPGTDFWRLRSLRTELQRPRCEDAWCLAPSGQVDCAAVAVVHEWAGYRRQGGKHEERGIGMTTW